MTSVLYGSGLNYQNGNPLGGEVRRLRNDLTEALRKVDQQTFELAQMRHMYNDLVNRLSEVLKDEDNNPVINTTTYTVPDYEEYKPPVVVQPVVQVPVQQQLTPQQQFTAQRNQVNTVVAGNRR